MGLTPLRSLGRRALAVLCVGIGLSGCKDAPDAQADADRAQSANRIVPGEALPAYDTRRYQIFKVDGRFFLAPREYGGADGSLAFYWPSRVAANQEGAEKKAPELVPSGPGQASNFYDVAIEIFLRAPPSAPAAAGMYELLLKAQAEGRVLGKTTLRQGLDMWRVRGAAQPEVWYVATALRDPAGQPPTLMCRDHARPADRCTSGFLWQPGLFADLRFRAGHAADWPEIYQEVNRVLQQITRA